jgi:hypothetical protein
MKARAILGSSEMHCAISPFTQSSVGQKRTSQPLRQRAIERTKQFVVEFTVRRLTQPASLHDAEILLILAPVGATAIAKRVLVLP